MSLLVGQASACARLHPRPYWLAAAALVALLAQAETRVEPKAYLDHVKYLASDELKGRATGTAELDKAAKYIAARFKSYGLKPVAGSYLQSFKAITKTKIGDATRFAFTLNGAESSLKLKDGFQIVGASGSGQFDGPIVFAGYGITAPAYNYDDYAGLDVKGKVVLIWRYAPQMNDEKSKFASRNDPSGHAQLFTKGINARMHGAKAVILVNPSFNRADDPLDTFNTADGQASIPFLQIRADLVESWFNAAGKTVKETGEAIDKDLQPRSFAFPATLAVNGNVDLQREEHKTANVTGYLPGQTSEYVVIGAHYDHLGLGDNHSLGKVGEIHHGADDNASGTAGVLELAHWFSKQPKQKRGILFLTFAGEELGLLGSGYYVGHPELPLEKCVAMINMDMIGRIRDRKIFLAGSGTGANFKELVDGVKSKYDFQVDLSETAGYGSSDHTSFTTKQVPVLFFFSGLHGDYHKPSDTWDKIDAPDAAKLLDLVSDIVLKLASDPARPLYVRVEPPSPAKGSSGGGSGYGPYFGSIPDFAEPPKGVRFADIRTGSPAEKAGLKPGDIMIEFDGKEVGNLSDYTYLLRSKKPGDEVLVKVLRSGETIEAKVLLTVRK